MHSGGYLDRNVNTASPSRLAIVVALHGAALAALMLAPAEMVERPTWFPKTIIFDVPDPVPPEPTPQTKPTDPSPGKQFVKQIPLEPFPLPKQDIVPLDPFPTGTGEGTGSQTTVTPPATPVFVDATMQRGAEIQPPYPTSMARQEIEGVVTVRVLIGADGRVKAVQQVSATDPEFFKATERQALRHWRFTPATRDGVAVESWRQMTVRFKLNA